MKRIAVSLGHNPDSQGAEFPFSPYSEYTHLSPLFGELIHALQIMGHLAYIVPTGSLTKKVDYINENYYDMAVELHLNADPDSDGPHDPEAYGCETLYFEGSTKGEQIANSIQKWLVDNLPIKSRGIKARTNLAFLRDTNCPAVILEPEFIDTLNPPDRDEGLSWILKNPKYVAQLIAQAIDEALTNS